jgi:uncharacterized OsmC-like protein
MSEQHVSVVVADTGEGKLSQAVMIGRHVLRADEPVEAGGDDLGPAPHEFLLAALGACTAMTVKMVAARKGWPLEHVEVQLRRGKLPSEGGGPPATLILRDILLDGPLDEEQRKKLLEIAEKCPVHKTLTGEIKIVSGLIGRGSRVTGGEE